MSVYSQRGGLTIIWTIENFSYSGLQTDDRLKTPVFTADSKRWCLTLFPRGAQDNNYITLAHYVQNDNFDHLYSILDSKGTPLTWTEVIHDAEMINLVRRDEVFGPRKTTFLPNDTLTIQCRIFKKGEAFTTPLSLYVRTRVKNDRYFEKWEILKFCSLEPHHQMTKEIKPLEMYGSKIDMTFCLDEEGRSKFNIRYSRVRGIECVFATCKVEAVDANGKKIPFAECENFFDCKNRIWESTCTSHITKSMLMCDKNLFLPNGTLTLMFECTLSSGVEYSRMEDPPTTSTNQERDLQAQPSCSTQSKTVDKYSPANTNVHGLSNISRDLLRVYETGLFSDLNLSVGDVSFPVHKLVLSARSPKFGAMFTANRKRKYDEEIESIEIRDTDADTLRRMIRFMYTDAVPEDLQYDEISKLYVAADKYKLKSLRDRCAAFLSELNVSVSNVCEILVLADLHQDEDLKSTIMDFISQNDKQVINSEPWKKLEKENAELTTETFRELYLKKMEKE